MASTISLKRRPRWAEICSETRNKMVVPERPCRISDLTDVSQDAEGNRKARKQKDLIHAASAQPRAKTIKLMDLVYDTVSIARNDRNFSRVFLYEKSALLKVLQDASDPRALTLTQRVYAHACDRFQSALNQYRLATRAE